MGPMIDNNMCITCNMTGWFFFFCFYFSNLTIYLHCFEYHTIVLSSTVNEQPSYKPLEIEQSEIFWAYTVKPEQAGTVRVNAILVLKCAVHKNLQFVKHRKCSLCVKV